MKHLNTKEIDAYRIQTKEDGYGPVYFRQYVVHIPVPFDVASRVFAELKSNAQKFLPSIVANVEKADQKKEIRIQEKQRYVVHLLGPWDAPLEAHAVRENFFEFLTLETAPEAGRLMYSVEPLSENESLFAIRSEARSGLFLFHIMYTLGLGQFFQRKVWEQVCLNVHNRCLEVAGMKKRKVVPVYSETVTSDREHSSSASNKPGALGV